MFSSGPTTCVRIVLQSSDYPRALNSTEASHLSASNKLLPGGGALVTHSSSRKYLALFRLATVWLLLSVGVTMNTRADEPQSIPPIAAEGEKVLPEDTTFTAECLLPWNDFITRMRWVLGTALVTQSEQWGDILRVDFKIPGEDLSPLVNRLICWRTSAGYSQLNIAIGQRVPPLERRN